METRGSRGREGGVAGQKEIQNNRKRERERERERERKRERERERKRERERDTTSLMFDRLTDR